MDGFRIHMDNIRQFINTLIAWNHRQPDARLAYADAEMTTHFDTQPAPWLSLFLVVKGKMTFTVGPCTQTVTRGQLVFLNAHFGNSGIMQGNAGLYACLSFDAGRRRGLESMSVEPLLMVCGIRDVDYVHSLCKRACTLAHMPPEHFPHIQIHAAVLEALTAVYEAIAPPDVTTAPGTSRVVREAMRIIHELHADPNLGLARMAERVGVSVGHLMKCFQLEGAGTPMRRLSEFRLARARTLLLRTDSPIREVALATGFRDPLYFSRLFRRATGQSPTEFRQGEATDRMPDTNGDSAPEPQASVAPVPHRRKAEESVPFVNVSMRMDGDIESVALLDDAVSAGPRSGF
jgi:AraC-like DNA-binding protein